MASDEGIRTNTADSAAGAASSTPRFTKISGAEHVRRHQAVHHGEGAIDVHRFAFSGERQTPHFVLFDMPPGSTEGVHAHGVADSLEGLLDEYYYIISGAGIMRIDGEVIAVAEGDFIHTPAGVSHGIENTAEDANLTVMLTVIAVLSA